MASTAKDARDLYNAMRSAYAKTPARLKVFVGTHTICSNIITPVSALLTLMVFPDVMVTVATDGASVTIETLSRLLF